MDTLVRDIGIIAVVAIACARWWFIAKEAGSRRYILLWGICFLVTGIAYIIGKSLDISSLMVVGCIAFISAIYFFFRAALSEHRAKKKQQHD